MIKPYDEAHKISFCKKKKKKNTAELKMGKPV